MRRLPVYLLLDTSGSMKGEPIEAVNVGLSSLLVGLRQDPSALESVAISLITFDREVQQVMPLTDLEAFQLPQIQTPDSGPTHLGQALQLLCTKVDREVRRNTDTSKGDWKPLLFIMTDGSPSDLQLYRECIPEIHKRNFAVVVACAAGPKAKTAILQELTPHVVSLDTMDSHTFKQFFKWVSDTVTSGNRSMGTTVSVELPPPPDVVHELSPV